MTFDDYLQRIADEKQRERMRNLLLHVQRTFPELKPVIKWNQPMFTDHGTFIIGFSIAKKHIALAPEHVALETFRDDFFARGYKLTKMLVQIPHTKEVDFVLIERVIAFQIDYKKDRKEFWLLPTREKQ